jgi:hypothetical protein
MKAYNMLEHEKNIDGWKLYLNRSKGRDVYCSSLFLAISNLLGNVSTFARTFG